ncbi:hypothetical protein EJ110_NYTH15608, partial [Nymphaea thermarum]
VPKLLVLPDCKAFNSLNSIHLSELRVTENLIQHLVLNCRLLEDLELSYCHIVGNIRIHGDTHLRLKNLTISHCFSQYWQLDIVAPNLSTFTFVDDRLIDTKQICMPSLTTAMVSFVGPLDDPRRDDGALFPLNEETDDYIGKFRNSFKRPYEIPNCLIHHLKRVEMTGFVGNEEGTQLIAFILKVAIALERAHICIGKDAAASKEEIAASVKKMRKKSSRAERSPSLLQKYSPTS